MTTIEQAIETTHPNSRYHHLRDDPDIRRWYEGQRRSSPISADVRLRRLGQLCRVMGITPQELAKADPVTAADIIDDFLTKMTSVRKEDGAQYTGSYLQTFVTSAKSWLAHFGVQPRRRIRVKDSDLAPTLRDEKAPERDELTELLQLGTLKQRAIKQLLAKSGVRPGVVGNYTGTDGLRIGDLPELALTSSGASFQSRPATVVVRAELSKTRRQYLTFLTASSAATILAYLNQRLQREERIDQDSPVISPTEGATRRGVPKRFLRSAQVGQAVRESIRPRFRLRPYALRVYFDTQLLQAEAKGLLPESFRVYWMGHKGAIDATYTTSKRRLPEALVHQMKEAFLKAEPYLDLEAYYEDPSEAKKREIQSRVSQLKPEALGQVLELIQAISGETPA
jgi:hypothetical protein